MERHYETIIYFIFIYYLLINFILFFLMGIDKKKAIKNKWRINEKVLFKFFILGGFLGGLISMRIFNHKTKKIKFYFIAIISILLHLLFIFIILKYKGVYYE